MMQPVTMFIGVFVYEFRMQMRRPALWLTFLFLIAALSFSLPQLWKFPLNMPLVVVVDHWTMLINLFFPLGIGVFLADRFPRDARTKMDEIFSALPIPLSIRLLGKYLGSTLATLVPLCLFYWIGIGCILFHTHNAEALLLAVEMLGSIILPGVLFVGAFSLACPAVMWVPLYQFLFIGYWFWGNLLPPYPHSPLPLPTLSDTLLTPIGSYISAGLFGVPAFAVHSASSQQGLASLLLLLGCSLLALLALWACTRWSLARK